MISTDANVLKYSAKSLSERGSAFMIALAALTILTIVGLSLAMVTETEMLLGANEWVITETHFAAEAGINTQISKLLVSNDTSKTEIVIPSYFGQADTSNQIGFDIRSTGMLAVTIEELPYSKANAGAADRFFSGYFYTLVRAQRTSWLSTAPVPECADLGRTMMGQKHVTTGFYYGPLAALPAEALINYQRAAFDSTTGESLCDGNVSDLSLVDILNTTQSF